MLKHLKTNSASFRAELFKGVGGKTTLNCRNEQRRRPRGNMMVFSVACTLGILGLIAFFGLGYVRLLGSNNEQKSAIEAASMTAAMDLSRIVIKTNEFGYVGLSDSAPCGAYTNDITDGDGYPMPVRGINTLLGTARLDLMIASVIPNVQGANSTPSDPLLTALALKDLQNVYAVQTKLQNALNDAVKSSPSTTYKDVQGNAVNVYADALAAYTKQPIRMTGKTAYANNSLKLTLGYLSKGMTTNTPVPQGLTGPLTPLSNSQQANNCYKAYVNCPFGGQDFMFAGIGDSVRLVDKKDWVASLANLPAGLPQPPLACIVKAEADQNLGAASNSFKGATVHAVACAAPANIADPRPYPGTFTISFPDGQVADFVSFGDMIGDSQLNDHPEYCTAYSAQNGDYPVDGGTLAPNSSKWPIASPPSPANGKAAPCVADYCKLAFYDWMRRGGTKVNIASMVNLLNQPFNAPGPDIKWNVPFVDGGPPQYVCKIAQGIKHTYEFNPDGTYKYSSQNILPMPYLVASHNQFYVEGIKGSGGFYQSVKPKNGAVSAATASYNTITISNITLPDANDEKPKGQRHSKNQNPGSTLTISNTFDVFVRDNGRDLCPGPTLGGKHGGEPLDGKKYVYGPPDNKDHGGDYGGQNGNGNPPLLAIVSEFAEDYSDTTTYLGYTQGPGGSTPRPTYAKNGNVSDICWRRDVQVTGSLASTLGFKTGYLAEEDPPY